MKGDKILRGAVIVAGTMKTDDFSNEQWRMSVVGFINGLLARLGGRT